MSPAATTTERELAITGMTCGSCAARVEKALGRQPGVHRAAVNLASEKALVMFDESAVTTEDLIAAVEHIGYGAQPLTMASLAEPDVDAAQPWLRRIAVGAPLGVAVLALSLFWMHEPWARWSALVLTVPVQFWCGWPFLHQALVRARARQANMDTLIALGTLAAFAFSVYQVAFEHAHTDHYFDTAALIVVFLLIGRYFEARAKSRGIERHARPARTGSEGGAAAGRRSGAHGPRHRAARRRRDRRATGREGGGGRRGGRGILGGR